MTQEFIPYEQALELKKLGFDEQCLAFYLADTLFTSNDIIYNSTDIPVIKAPLYQQAFRWFDENTSFQGFVIASLKEGHFDWEILNLDTEEKIECKEYYHTRLEAELACLKKLIEIVKNK